jgi:TolB protein
VNLADSGADDTAPAWSPDGGTVYFVSTRTGAYEIFAVAASGGPATQITTGSRIIGRPAATPDGAALLFARRVSGGTATEVVRLDLGTGAATVVTSQDDSEPAISPDGSRIALRSFRSGDADLVVLDAAGGGHPVAITSDPASDGAPAFAPATLLR